MLARRLGIRPIWFALGLAALAVLAVGLASCTRLFWPSIDLSMLPPDQAEALEDAITGDDPKACLAAVRAVGVRATPVEDRRNEKGCGYSGAVRVTQTTMPLSSPFMAECPTVAALAAWEIAVVRPAAQSVFGEAPARLDHVGTYNCRTVNRRPGARLSQHALGKAIDVSAIRLASGRTIGVTKKGWEGDGPEGQFLRALRDGACGAFRAVIGPERDAAHSRHFHLDLGPYRICR